MQETHENLSKYLNILIYYFLKIFKIHIYDSTKHLTSKRKMSRDFWGSRLKTRLIRNIKIYTSNHIKIFWGNLDSRPITFLYWYWFKHYLAVRTNSPQAIWNEHGSCSYLETLLFPPFRVKIFTNIKGPVFLGIEIFVIKIRRSWDSLTLIMVIPIQAYLHLYDQKANR